MNQLLDLDAKLTILSNNPCACTVCVRAARLAKRALAEVSPSAATLLTLSQGTPEFGIAEQAFHAEEIARLQEAYDTIGHGRCERMPALALDTSSPPPPPQFTITPIPDLPDPDAFRERIEFYRKRGMGPRMTHRRAHIEMKKNPRIPGSYIIK